MNYFKRLSILIFPFTSRKLLTEMTEEEIDRNLDFRFSWYDKKPKNRFRLVYIITDSFHSDREIILWGKVKSQNGKKIVRVICSPPTHRLLSVFLFEGQWIWLMVFFSDEIIPIFVLLFLGTYMAFNGNFASDFESALDSVGKVLDKGDCNHTSAGQFIMEPGNKSSLPRFICSNCSLKISSWQHKSLR